MRFTLTVDMDNSAFEEEPKLELVDVLERVTAAVMQRGVGVGLEGRVRDTNGNTVGTWRIDAD